MSAHNNAAHASASAHSTDANGAVESSSHTLELPDFTMHYDLHGPPTGPKVLLAMGLLTDGAAWKYQTSYLAARGYHCVSYDNRGVYGSSTPGYLKLHTYTTRRMANDAARLVEHLGWSTFHVIGISMGGMIALEFALAMPASRILSLTLIVTHAGGFGGVAPLSGVASMIKSIFTRDNEVRLNSTLSMLYSKASLANPDLRTHLVGHHRVRMANRVVPKLPALIGHSLAVYTHFVSNSNLLRIRYSHFNTLIVVGEEDQLVRMSNSRMLAHALGGRLVVIPDGGHGLLAEYPEVLNPVLLKFLNENSEAKHAQSLDESDDANTPIGESMLPPAAEELECELDAESSACCSAPHALEHQALALTCAHSVACVAHNIGGLITGFIPAFLFRWVFFDSVSLGALGVAPVSRWEQSVKFGLMVGMARASFRAVTCIINAVRARRWVAKHNLAHPQAGVPLNNQSKRGGAALRKGIPHGKQHMREELRSVCAFVLMKVDLRAFLALTPLSLPRCVFALLSGVGFEFPLHSFLLLITFAYVAYSRKLFSAVQ
jgi:3-oxoadipate enol-lactonase